MSKKTLIHVNSNTIRSNAKHGEKFPVLTVRRGSKVEYGHEVLVLGDDGEVLARVVYRPDAPLACGARVWIETEAEVVVASECQAPPV